MNNQAKLQELVEMAEAAGLYYEMTDTRVTVYLVGEADYKEAVSKGGIRPCSVTANIRNGARKSVAYSFRGVRTSFITRTEAIADITAAA